MWANWDSNARIYFLRWQENDILYEIIFGGGSPRMPGYFDKDNLITLAEDMQ